MNNETKTIKQENQNYITYEISGQQYFNNILYNVVYIELFHKNSWESSIQLKSKVLA